MFKLDIEWKRKTYEIEMRMIKAEEPISCTYITKTYLYNFDSLKPHFYIVKLGFAGVQVIFLISAQNMDCGDSLEPRHRGGSNESPQSMF